VPALSEASAAAAGVETRHVLAPVAIGVVALALMAVVAASEGLPIRDPDARYVGSPLALIALIVALFIALDVLPRAIRVARSGEQGTGAAIREVFGDRWWGRRGVIVVICILGFYATYLSYRNLKSFLPFVTDGLHDTALLDLDQAMFFGHQPSVLLHDLLGTEIAATLLSAVYLAFLTFVPLSIGFALIWSSRVAVGVWYITALALDWMLGALSYYVLPSLGPVYARPGLFEQLPTTGVSELQQTLLQHRREVIANPQASDAVQSIAGFASLHVAVLFTAALIAQLVRAPRPLRIGLWVYLGLTILATIYFGWHYVIDDVVGLAIGAVAVGAAGVLVGFGPRRPTRQPASPAGGTTQALAQQDSVSPRRGRVHAK
jgi:hypothetical protein